MMRVLAPWFVAGIEPGVRSAPILGWMVAKKLDAPAIAAYCAKRGWKVEYL